MIKKGVVLSFLTAGISGVSIFVNALFVANADPLVYTLIRNGVVALMLTAVLIFLGQWKTLGKLTKKEWGKLLVIGAVGGGIPFAMFFTGLSQIGALNGNVLQKTLFLWVAILAIPLLKERLTKVQLIGYAALLAGMFMVGGTFRVVPKTGTWLVLGATILWAIENVIAKVTLKTVPASIVSWGRMVFGIPFLLVGAVLMGKTGLLLHVNALAPMPILISSVLLVAYVLTWYTALSKAPATMVSSILVFAPVVTAIVALVASHKAISGVQIPTFLLLTVGALFVSSVGVTKPQVSTTEGHE